ncbi:MAG: bifunctional riboflavin kinase/FAD synthetase [Planctomycetota bacterium]|nr:bifunctional riboflavin kinase/FAD synthetase [Planctomycetota bacterium]
MQILNPEELPSTLAQRGCVATVGVFDGVHLGHRHVLNQVIRSAEAHDCASVMVSFASHPKSLLLGNAPATITSLEHRLRLFEDCGIDATLVLEFNEELRQLTAAEFVQRFLIDGLGLKELVFGFDSKFGRDRGGNPQSLLPMSKELGFDIKEIEPLRLNDRAVSSTAIREAVQLGDLKSAQAMLGRPASILGTVVHGDKRGRQLGFPTANLKLHHELSPPQGVYACMVKINGNEQLVAGAVNLGLRPSFDSNAHSIEVHLIDFDGDLYNQCLEVFFLERLRPEQKFANVDELRRQIAIDVNAANLICKQFISGKS